jgi:hypothetical protein
MFVFDDFRNAIFLENVLNMDADMGPQGKPDAGHFASISLSFPAGGFVDDPGAILDSILIHFGRFVFPSGVLLVDWDFHLAPFLSIWVSLSYFVLLGNQHPFSLLLLQRAGGKQEVANVPLLNGDLMHQIEMQSEEGL